MEDDPAFGKAEGNGVGLIIGESAAVDHPSATVQATSAHINAATRDGWARCVDEVGEAGGVGYDVTIPVSTFSLLPDKGAEVRLRIHTHVREDVLALFGFWSTEEKTMFEKLISVSGIGPRLAVTVLSGLATGDLIASIRSGDLHRLVRIPGIGKKTAERIVLELRDKLDVVAAGAAAADCGTARRH